MSERTRLTIAGVPSRVSLHVAERDVKRATLEQRLPFLAVGTEIADDEGRTGRIARVAVALEGGVPKLVVELAYDAVPLRAPSASRSRRDQTMSYERPTVPEPLRRPRVEAQSEGSAQRSRPLALAFPLEKRRPPPEPARLSWFARLFG